MSFRMVKGEDRTEEEITRMVVSYRGGNTDLVIPLIKAHITIANKIAGHYARYNHYRREDLYAVAFLGLCEAVDRAAYVLEDNGITPYLARSIKGKIQTFLCSDCLIPIPRGEFKKRMETEDASDYIARTSNDDLTLDTFYGGVIENIAVIIPLTNRVMENLDIPTTDHSLDKMSDLYHKMGLTEIECQIIDMRLDGRTYDEIGTALGMTGQAVRGCHLQNIKSKLGKLGIKMPNHTPILAATKVCTACKRELSLSFFYRISGNSFKSHCKECMKGKYEQNKQKGQGLRGESVCGMLAKTQVLPTEVYSG